MATIDFTITNAEYNQMMTVLNAMRAKLVPLKAPLARFLAHQPAKVKAITQTNNGRFLREVYRVRQDLNTYFSEIGWKDD